MSSPGLRLRCYCCGRPIAEAVVMVVQESADESPVVDRAFIMLPKCAERAEGRHVRLVITASQEIP